MSELKPARTLDMVAAEIRLLTGNLLSSTLEIGRRLEEAKEMLPHGEFLGWVKENAGYSSSQANNFMRLFREYGAAQGSLFGPELNCQTFGNLSPSSALALLAVPAEEREAFAQEVKADELSTRELKEAIKARNDALEMAKGHKEARERAEDKLSEALTENEGLRRSLDEADKALDAAKAGKESAEDRLAEAEGRNLSLKEQLEEALNRPVEVAVQEPDPAEVEARVNRAAAEKVKEALKKTEAEHQEAVAKMQAELDREVAENNKLERQLAAAKKKAKEAKTSEEAEALKDTVAELEKRLAMAKPEVTAFKAYFDMLQQAYKRALQGLEQLEEEDKNRMSNALRTQLRNWEAGL